MTAERIAQRSWAPVRGRRAAQVDARDAAAAVLVLAAVALLRLITVRPRLRASSSARPQRIAALRGSPGACPRARGFAVGSVVSFPILVLIGATVVALGPVARLHRARRSAR